MLMGPMAAGSACLVLLHANLLLASLADEIWVQRSSVVPSWQSIVSDTGFVLPLFDDAAFYGGRRDRRATVPPRDPAKGDPPPPPPPPPPPSQATNLTSSSWTVSSADGAYRDVPASVPGDVVTDLWRAGCIDDPYWGRNFLAQQQVWMGTPHDDERATTNGTVRRRTWVYETNVTLPRGLGSGGTNRRRPVHLLVLEGVKMGADVEWNGVRLGTIRNQFVRTVFRLPPNALERSIDGISSLRVVFDPDIGTRGRFMACSGGWDWAPYTRAVDDRGSRVFTFGITRPAYVVEAERVWIERVTTRIYPRDSVSTACTQDFRVHVQVHLRWCSSGPNESAVSIRVRSNFSSDVVRVTVAANQSSANVSLAAKAVDLWWPSGMGSQNLYSVWVALESDSCCPVGSGSEACECPSIERRVGFRTTAMITDNATAHTRTPNGDGSGRHGMVLRVNGLDLWCRGANLIPMDQLEGRWIDRVDSRDGSDSAYSWVVQSTRRSNMNMLRVWGGGLIPPQEFYDLCDENGILIYQDLMFVEEDGHGAFDDDKVREEIVNLVEQLVHHPAIVIWNGCNECTANDLYASFVMKTVADIDDTRAIWPNSPSWYGWESGVRTSDGKPNGRPLRIRQSDGGVAYQLESHGPYPRGYSTSFPGVNGFPAANSNETLLPPSFRETEVGIAYPNTFISEFGSTAHSSFESMSQVLPSSDWSLHGSGSPDTCVHLWGNLNRCDGTNSMAERNYPADSRIAAYFGEDVPLGTVGPKSFQRQLYLSMIAQALWMKGQIETFRSGNSFGTLIWQMNEVWPTGGWGCIEYYNGRQQIGRWKPLMFLLQSYLFQDVIVACGESGLCFARNDNNVDAIVNITLEAWDLMAQQYAFRSSVRSFALPGGRSQDWFKLCDEFLHNAHAVLITASSTSSRVPEDPSVYLWTLPKDLPLQHTIRFEVQVEFGNQPYFAVMLDIRSSHLALYVVVSTGALGHFSHNAFALRPGTTKTLLFQPIAASTFDRQAFLRTLRIDHLGESSNVVVANKLRVNDSEVGATTEWL